MKNNNHYGTVSPPSACVPPTAPPMEQPRETVTHVQGAATGDAEPQQHSQSQQHPPPPPYNEAINYPPVPPAPPYPVYQPNTFPPNIPVGTVAAHMPHLGNNGAPIYVMPAAPMPTIVSTTTVVPAEVRQQAPVRTNPCAHCTHGVVRSETDYCCLCCLLIFSIISFPFGLVLLLFIPLAFRRRCSACRHLYT
ncbi:hypothetical protein niasHS_000070 [Heterodera schachtii]|uniref:Brain protein I3 n=2 Tax=Heterodera TaxID=34509 RepID=A0ABD2K6T9_HETSC